jgi:hypothetical protein
LRHGKGIAVDVLTDAGVHLEQARAELRPRLSTEMPVPPISARRRLGAPRDRILGGSCAVGAYLVTTPGQSGGNASPGPDRRRAPILMPCTPAASTAMPASVPTQ